MGCGCNDSCLWIILLLCCCGGFGNGSSFSDGCGDSCGCILPLILILCCCGGNSRGGCAKC